MDKLGALKGKVGSLKAGLSEAVGGVREFGSRAADAFTGVVERVGDVAVGLAKIGAVAGIAAVTYGVVHLNKELENTQISLAAIFSAQGLAANLQDGMVLASSSMEKMRKDAAALPGEFEDLKNIFRTVAAPGIQAGMNLETLRKFSAETMAVGAVMELRSDQTAREMAMLLGGRAGGHNVLGMRLGFMGDKAHELHEASPEKRVEMINKELAKYAPAIQEFQKSWEGISTTTTSNIKILGAAATFPLFQSAKDALSKINDWMDIHHDDLELMAARFGNKLAYAFDVGVAGIERWYPAVRDFAVNAFQEIHNIWERIEPVVERVGAHIRDFLSDKESIHKLEHVLEMYAAVKIGGAAASFAGPVGSIASGWLGMMGGGGAAAGGGGIATVLEGGATALWPLGLAAAFAAAEFWGANHAITDSTSMMHAQATTQWQGLRDQWSNLQNEFDTIWDGMKGAAERAEPALVAISDILGTGLVAAARAGSFVISQFMESMGIVDLAKSLATLRPTPNEPALEHPEDYFRGRFGEAIEAQAKAAQGLGKPTPPPKHPGGAGVHIDKVEIVVTSNNEPNRVARLVKDEFLSLRRHARISPDVPNWASATPF